MTILEKIKEQNETIEALKGLWASLMPGAPVPTSQQLNTWLGMHSADNLLAAIQATAKKYRILNNEMSKEWMLRYCSSVANNLKVKQEVIQ